MRDPEGNTLTDPFDIGYWTRAYGRPRPTTTLDRAFHVDLQREKAMQAGWDECDREIAAEDSDRRRRAHA